MDGAETRDSKDLGFAPSSVLCDLGQTPSLLCASVSQSVNAGVMMQSVLSRSFRDNFGGALSLLLFNITAASEAGQVLSIHITRGSPCPTAARQDRHRTGRGLTGTGLHKVTHQVCGRAPVPSVPGKGKGQPISPHCFSHCLCSPAAAVVLPEESPG